MHAKFFALATLFAVAAAAPGGEPEGNNICSTGPVQCCNQVQDIHHPKVKQAIKNGGLLNIIDLDVLLGEVNLPVGLDCSPISIIGVPGNQCSAQAVCCKDNKFNGVVALGCSPVNVNL
ncbi:Hydrophobin-B [Leucoagaricus sp. SymC.cos]|nr:Hydrophobin-B [Leucoagaricus sp. SymC.cos]